MAKTFLNYREEVGRYALPGRIKLELVRVFEKNNVATVKGRVGSQTSSYRTREARLSITCAALVELRDICGFKIEMVSALSKKHLEALGHHWEARGQKPATIDNKFSTIRTFAEWIGKRGMVEASHKYVVNPESAKRRLNATEDKSWAGHGIDARELIEKVKCDDERVGVALQLCREFGLRITEALMFRPWEDIAHGFVMLSHGTKGGRSRPVRIESVEQRNALEATKNLTSKRESLIPKDTTSAKWTRHVYAVLARHGITKSGIGITVHGLRHERFHQMWRERTGIEPPIRGGLVRALDPALVKETREEITNTAGHSDLRKAGAYLSTPRTTGQEAQRLREQEATLIAELRAGKNQSEAAKVLGVNRARVTHIKTKMLAQGRWPQDLDQRNAPAIPVKTTEGQPV